MYLDRKYKRMANLLGPQANNEELVEASRRVFADASLPDELTTWFSWHNGQSKMMDYGLIPGSGFGMVKVDIAVKIWEMLTELQETGDLDESWNPAYFPLFANGGGDYICLDTSSGAVVEWFHDDEGGKLADDLAGWVAGFVPGYLAEKKAKRPRRVEFHLDQARPLGNLTPESIFRCSIGSVILGGPADLCPDLPESKPHCIVMVRAHYCDTWNIGRGPDIDACCQRIISELATTGDPFQYYDEEAAASWLGHLLATPEGVASARRAEATVTIQ